jgi:hypothetical protein
MNNLLRAIMFLATCVVAVLVYAMFTQAIVDLQPAVEAGRTARALAAEQSRQVQAQEWNATLRAFGDNAAVIAAWAAAAAVLVVAAVQAGRTLRHAQTERTRRRALLAWYIAQRLPAGAHAEIVTHRGQLAVADHDAGEIIPYPVAQLEMARTRFNEF